MSDDQRKAWISTSKKPVAYLTDHVGNFGAHGLPDLPVEIGLDDSVAAGGRKQREIKLRACVNPSCIKLGEPFSANLSACPHCNFELPIKSRTNPKEVMGDLGKLDATTLARLISEIRAIQGPARIPTTVADNVARLIEKRWDSRAKSSAGVAEAIRKWAKEFGKGTPSSTMHVMFYRKFGVDIATAVSRSFRENVELIEKIEKDIKDGKDTGGLGKEMGASQRGTG
jgi:hypothetical protein